MNNPVQSHYERKIRNKIETIERLQMKMNANLSNPHICIDVERKQSIERVELIFLKRKLEMVKERYNKAA
jgi:FtsZ-binding cell division protein ZapB